MSDAPLQRVRVGTGMSGDKDAHEAGKAAALAALKPLAGETPALIIVFATPRYDLPALLAGVRSVTGTALLIGSTGSGEIVGGQYLGFGGGVGVLAMTAGPYRFAAASAGDIPDDAESLDKAGQALSRTSREMAGSSPYAAALLITDSLLGDLQQFVQGVYRITGPRVAIVGGAAGDEQQFVRSSVFHDDAILDKGALVLWIASDRPLRVVTRHGWQPIGAPLLVTRAAGTEIAELGGRSAAEVYDDQLSLPSDLTPTAFWAISILHPFGLTQPDGSHVIRVARKKTPDGGLRIHGCVPSVGSAVQIMSGSADTLLSVAEEVVSSALDGMPDASVLLTFSCAARAVILGERAPEEARRLQDAAGEIPIFGFYCCAEFARTAGVLGTHNATVTAVAL
jgi:hypothetical protein